MSDALLARLAEASGIVPSYYDLRGEQRDTTPETQRSLLAAMGYAAATSADIEASLRDVDRRNWQRLLPEASVVRSRSVMVTLPAALGDQAAQWSLTCEDGSTRDGSFRPAETAPVSVREIEGATFGRYAMPLPDDLPLGYHRMTLTAGPEAAEGLLIVAPGAAYCPPWLADGRKLWGTACHLYSVRSRRNWGIGDFSDLASIAHITASQGGGVVAINPVHALFPHRPTLCSPYWPSSRLFLNPLYLDLTAIPEFKGCAPVQQLLRDDSFIARIAAANAASEVDYPEVSRLKFDLLQPLVRQLDDERPMELDGFIASGGSALQNFAVFCALSDHFGGQPWTAWPQPYQDPASDNVARWVEAHRRDVRFHLLMQWLVERQLAATASDVSTLDVGIMRDLAVGVSPDGADAWRDQALYPRGTRFGAPPDQFSATGQDWGLPPPNPRVFAHTGYQPFIAAVRANMRHAGGLRIDHVMSLERLYWIPEGAKADSGAYVRYPFDDLLGIVALESQRARCLVVGEDLGTIGDGFRERMEQENVLSTRIFYFERHASGLFKRPDQYPGRSVAQATTHDTAPLAGYWSRADIAVRAGIEKDFSTPAAEVARTLEQAVILDALIDQGLIPAEAKAGDNPAANVAVEDLIMAVHRYLARAPSCLMLVQLGDVMAALEQINLPGTMDEYPNWRKKLPQTIEDMAASESWRRTARIISEIRAGR